MYSGSWTYCCRPRVWGGLAELVNCSSGLVHGDVNGICFQCRSPTLGLVYGFLTTEKVHEHHGCPVPAIKVIGHKVICFVTANMLTCLRYWQFRTGRDIRDFSSNPPLSQMKLTPESRLWYSTRPVFFPYILPQCTRWIEDPATCKLAQVWALWSFKEKHKCYKVKLCNMQSAWAVHEHVRRQKLGISAGETTRMNNPELWKMKLYLFLIQHDHFIFVGFW